MSLLRLLTTTIGTGLLASATLLSPATAGAQVVSRTGNISSIYLSAGGNYGFRVSLTDNGTNPLSDCPALFAYMNTSFDNYQAYATMINSAWSRGKVVTLITTKDTQGFCQLAELYLPYN